MIEVKPFRATVYNQAKIRDLSKVVCPPYDVISAEDQEFFHKIHPHNFIRLILGRQTPYDNAEHNRYTRAKDELNSWLKEGALKKIGYNSFLFYQQRYVYDGQPRERLGFMGLMKLATNKRSKIFPHENTQLAAKEDRFQLMSSVKANLSPIFVLFHDEKKVVERIFQKHVLSKKPLIDITDKDGMQHTVWCLDDQKLIARIQRSLRSKQIFIADGHHRYEVGLSFREHMRKMHKKKITLPRPYEYIMTYFTDLDPKRLQILPVHRVIRSEFKKERLNEFFTVRKEIDQKKMFQLLKREEDKGFSFGLYYQKRFSFLKLKDIPTVSKNTEGISVSEWLDVGILQNKIFPALSIKVDDVLYVKDAQKCIAMVDGHDAKAVFFLNPVRSEQLSAIASLGEKMPPKSTYFYPKALSGLAINKFEIA
ncbi:DUF1015 domain-containing protein [Candidatus Omnitrophota bacterium]